MKYNKFIALALAGTMLGSTPVFAATPNKTVTSEDSTSVTTIDGKPVLTIEDAISSALVLDGSLSLNKQQATLIAEQLDALDDLATSTYQQQYITQQQNTQERQYLIDSIGYKVKSAYNTIVLQQEQIANYKLDIELKTTQLDNLAVKKDLGLITALDYEAAELELTNLKATLKSTTETLNSNIANFKILTGKSLDNYSLLNTIAYDAFKVESSNIEAYFRSKVKTYLKYKTALVKVQEDHLLDAYKTTAPTYVEYLSQKFSLKSSETTLETTEDTLTQSLITSYSSLLSIQEQIATLEEQYAYAKKQLEVYSLKYDLGLISKLDYLTQQNTLKDTEYTLLTLKNQHNVLAEMLQKPWLMG